MNELLATVGPLAGRRFEIPPSGMLLGRSSTCDIAVADPALSRSHCQFEWRDGSIWVTDLNSANGTTVNGMPLGADPVRLAAGDVVRAGDNEFAVAAEPPPAEPPAAKPVPAPAVDLGLSSSVPDADGVAVGDGDGAAGKKDGMGRLIMWGGAVVAVAVAAWVILTTDRGAEAVVVKPMEVGREFMSVSFEKVEANGDGIYRYALEAKAGGDLAVEIDDVPRANGQNVRKRVKLKTAAQDALARIFEGEALFSLDPEYTGPSVLGSYARYRVKVIRADRVFETVIENATEPTEFREMREKLETFSKNELGIWAIQYSADKLIEMSRESQQAADAKWDERDVEYGNLAAAIALYDEAVLYLDTVNPKPDGYETLMASRSRASAELDKRYREQRFRADKALNLSDWVTARRELSVLRDMVPDSRDPRNAEASSKLLDVESRIQKGVGK